MFYSQLFKSSSGLFLPLLKSGGGLASGAGGYILCNGYTIAVKEVQPP
jgi:hypothetical protein